MPQTKDSFLAGVIEGFYGRPWSRSQRLELFDWLRAAGLNTYCYSPKDDLKHRAIWRESYDAAELQSIGELVDACSSRGIRFVFALAPGLDLRYSETEETTAIEQRYAQLIDLGVTDFALLFDDIPDRLREADRERFGSFAHAHAHVTNSVFAQLSSQLQDPRLLFCPTPYCGRMDSDNLGGERYLDVLGEELHTDIDLFWTGPEIISAEIDDEHARQIGGRLKRKPILWDNLHANDYDQRRLFTGPYSGRTNSPRELLGGVLLNPNCEFEANFLPVRTLGDWFTSTADYYRHASLEKAIQAWLPRFAGVGDAWTDSELKLLVDVFFLPHELGQQAIDIHAAAKRVIQNECDEWKGADETLRRSAARVNRIFDKLTELENRELFCTFNRQWWDLREEMQLIVRFMDWRLRGGTGRFASPEHLLGTYRGGAVASLQHLLHWNDDGTLSPS